MITLFPGPGRLSDAASPDLRGRSYRLYAEVESGEGVLISHGDRTGGYALRIDDGHLVHDYVHAGVHSVVRSEVPVPSGPARVGVHVNRTGTSATVVLVINGAPVGGGEIPSLARARTGYTGVDIGCDRGVTVGGYPPPARFTGLLRRIEIEVDDDQCLDGAAVLEIEGATG
ncbi:MAG: arylsulfatase [Frankiales bacterium]|nr:arylsulfatase [Frankiales bacterium]